MKRLKSIAMDFRRGMLGQAPSDRMCFAVCAPLQGYLSMLGYETKLVQVDFGCTDHCWLELPDGRILDPTADQFSAPGARLPKVYLGPVPALYLQWMAGKDREDAATERSVSHE